jgi:prepilin-type N-terminal cleavage/methylation domain-containing protein
MLGFKKVCSKAASYVDAAFFFPQGEGMAAARRGVTLMEIIVVMIIVGVLAAAIMPNFVISAEKTQAQTAK